MKKDRNTKIVCSKRSLLKIRVCQVRSSVVFRHSVQRFLHKNYRMPQALSMLGRIFEILQEDLPSLI